MVGGDAVDPTTLKAFQLTEKELQNQITSLATTLGWHWYHTYDSRRSTEGFPDLVLVREVVLFMEVKKQGEHLDPDQRNWAEWLPAAGAYYMTAWPEHFFEVAKLLANPLATIGEHDNEATSATMATDAPKAGKGRPLQEGGQNGKGDV